MGRIKGHYEWDDDNLAPGQKKEGGLHQNLFDSDGNLKGSARFIPDDGSESDPIIVTETVYVTAESRRRTQEEDELEEAIAALVALFVAQGIAKVRPHVEQWWRESVRPAIAAQRGKLVKRRLRRRTPEPAAVIDEDVVEPSQELGRAPVENRPSMSRAEAQARCLAALAARAYSDEQMRLVAGADIVDVENLDELQHSLAELPPDQVNELIRAMATNPTMLAEGTLAELASLLSRRALRTGPGRDRGRPLPR